MARFLPREWRNVSGNDRMRHPFRRHRTTTASRRLELVTSAVFTLLAALAGCQGMGELPAADLSEPGWTVWYGQALWQPSGDRPEMAGELIAAQHAGGGVLVSFTKPPVPVFTARSTPQAWQLDFLGGRTHSGRGAPPRRFVWFQLPDIIQGEAPPAGWEVERSGDGALTLRRGNERIRLVLDS